MTRRTPAAHRRRTGSLTRGAGATRQVRRDEVEHAGARGELGDDGHGDDEEQDRPHPVGDREGVDHGQHAERDCSAAREEQRDSDEGEFHGIHHGPLARTFDRNLHHDLRRTLRGARAAAIDSGYGISPDTRRADARRGRARPANDRRLSGQGAERPKLSIRVPSAGLQPLFWRSPLD
ncbi:hypothetical protein [Microbacterium sp. F2E]|uniref:hypothetical protein n=1 Tax=Microbacterium sp. F2E TaxID=2895284 RepID=UPI0027E07E5E|nr:hypothetical protein [Microbacterium sp. F2E]